MARRGKSIITLEDDSTRSNQSMSKNQKSVFFRDGKRKIDAILVYDNTETDRHRDTFIRNLKSSNLDLEEELSAHKEHIVYIKIHAPEKVLDINAKLHGIPAKCETLTVIPEDRVFKPFLTILNDPDPDPEHPLARRAWKTISKEQPMKYTNCERSAIVFRMMDYTYFGNNDEPFKVGIQQMIVLGIFIAAYPLHDGPWEWPEDDISPLNDRQLLAVYWANYKMWNKEQPLTTIESYFGPEIGTYFAWLGHYNKMLTVAALMGIFTFLYGLYSMFFLLNKPLYAKLTQKERLLPVDLLFTTSFMELWKRRQASLILKWNLNTAIEDVKRPEFQATATHVQRHNYTGEMEQVIPLGHRIVQYSISIFTMIFMIVAVLGTTFVIVVYECALKFIGIPKFYISLTSSVITCVVMIIFRRMYGAIAFKMTYAECPRTHLEFTKSYMLKMIIFSFTNSYGKMLYVAFFKGKFFTYPGDPKVRLAHFPVAAEICDPTGCIFEVFLLLAVCMVIKPITSNFLEIVTPILKIWKRNRQVKKEKVSLQGLQIWEQDFELNAWNQYDIMNEVEEMVIQYGFVTLLVAAFPLAPLMALINNIFEIRIDSTKLIKYFRRSQSVVATTMDVWFDTLQCITYIAVITNALYISFTSSFIPSVVYYFHYRRDFSGFYTFILSKYREPKNYWTHNVTECLYVGSRYGPDDPEPYQLTFTHYYMLSCKLSFSMVFAVVILGVTGLIAYAIPDIPRGVQDLISHNSRKERRRTVMR